MVRVFSCCSNLCRERLLDRVAADPDPDVARREVDRSVLLAEEAPSSE